MDEEHKRAIQRIKSQFRNDSKRENEKLMAEGKHIKNDHQLPYIFQSEFQTKDDKYLSQQELPVYF